jgi:hypothetical protein
VVVVLLLLGLLRMMLALVVVVVVVDAVVVVSMAQQQQQRAGCTRTKIQDILDSSTFVFRTRDPHSIYHTDMSSCEEPQILDCCDQMDK